MFGVVSNWKYALIVALLITVGGGKFYYEEKIENKNQKIDQIKVNIIQLEQAIEEQNREIEQWKEKGEKRKERIEEKQKKALDNREKKNFETVNENASCEKSMEWLRKQANENN